ncbi:MAG: SDR family oxidoreductase [Vampirovibrio sp.]|nr:SDR family oxidoreductase [Vampirovibrio sp.]
MTKNILITGAASGIGLSAAVTLANEGLHVFAGVRKTEDLSADALSHGNITPIFLDVTDTESIQTTVNTVNQQLGNVGLDGLINNAGIVVAGPLEWVPLSRLKTQLDVNVIGLVAVTQACLPMLRLAKGRIINIGSISGESASPFIGPYTASKHALEAISDALRLELDAWGIRVSLIQPGSIDTPLWDKSLKDAEQDAKQLVPEIYSLYQAQMETVRQSALKAKNRGIPPQEVTEQIVHSLLSPRPKSRYVVGNDARFSKLLNLLPTGIKDTLIKMYLNLPKDL